MIESKSPTTLMMSFFPSTIAVVALSFLTLISYIIERKTEYLTLGMIFSMCVERFSSWMLFIYSTSIYEAQGLTEVKSLSIIHGLAIAILLIVNLIVLFKFRKLFGIG